MVGEKCKFSPVKLQEDWQMVSHTWMRMWRIYGGICSKEMPILHEEVKLSFLHFLNRLVNLHTYLFARLSERISPSICCSNGSSASATAYFSV